MDTYYYQDTLVAIRIARIKKGSVPITDEKEPLQMVTLKHPKGTYLKAHLHEPKKRTTHRLQECLIVRTGKVKVDLYDVTKVHFKSLFVNAGQALLLVEGGYGIRLMQDSEIIELKNGPFVPDKVLIKES